MKILFIIGISLFFTYLCINQSKKIGRLSASPDYDDVIYFLSGSIILKEIQHFNVKNIQEVIKREGLHSPYSTLLALLSYAALGIKDTSPYCGNILVVITYLSLLAWIFRKLQFINWAFLQVLFLTVPFITMGVVEFRPDIAWSILVGFGVFFIVTAESFFRKWTYSLIGGAIFGLALLVKPSTFVLTILLFSGAVFSRLIGYYISKTAKDQGKALIGTAVFLLTVILISLPYWYYFYNDIWQYFWDNSFGKNKMIWAYHEKDFLLFYLKGAAFYSNLGFPGLIIIFLATISFVRLFPFKKELMYRMYILLLAILGVFLINTVASMKSPFLGGVFYSLLLFTSAFLISSNQELIYSNNQKDKKLWRLFSPSVILFFCMSIAILTYNWPDYSNWGRNPNRCISQKRANNFMNNLLEKNKENLPHSIIFTQSGPIVPELTRMFFIEKNKDVTINNHSMDNSAKVFASSYRFSDWIIIQEQTVLGGSSNLPAEIFLPEMISILKSDKQFSLIGECKDTEGKKIWVYAKS